ncbi:hypothetical protein Q3G72_012514 [Acer saccharum]|nr:hypothetical protein Q3G72_012514 [Acer saccharum]
MGLTETKYRPTPRPRGGPFTNLELLDVSDDESDNEDGLIEDLTNTVSTWVMETVVLEPEVKELEWKKKKEVKFVMLYVGGTIMGYRSSKKNQSPKTPLIQIHGVTSKEEVAWYVGKKISYIYNAETKKMGSKYRCIWGKVTRHHSNSGVARTSFKSNLPPKSFGSIAMVFLYPSNI